VAGGPMRFDELERLLRALGFDLDRVSGSHYIYVHRESGAAISLQPDGKAAKRYQLKQVRVMIEDLELSLDERDDG
jgi:predicted RNA binding protein YcfA (HicA-like mRNA interferase family)